jgi:hypothetical protein
MNIASMTELQLRAALARHELAAALTEARELLEHSTRAGLTVRGSEDAVRVAAIVLSDGVDAVRAVVDRWNCPVARSLRDSAELVLAACYAVEGQQGMDLSGSRGAAVVAATIADRLATRALRGLPGLEDEDLWSDIAAVAAARSKS